MRRRLGLRGDVLASPGSAAPLATFSRLRRIDRFERLGEGGLLRSVVGVGRRGLGRSVDGVGRRLEVVADPARGHALRGRGSAGDGDARLARVRPLPDELAAVELGLRLRGRGRSRLGRSTVVERRQSAVALGVGLVRGGRGGGRVVDGREGCERTKLDQLRLGSKIKETDR